MFLCICKSVSDTQIREAVEQGARSVGDLSARFGLGTECGKCLDDVRQVLDACLLAPSSASESVPVSAPIDHATAVAVEMTPPASAVEPAPQRAAWFAVDL
ncbi:MAG: (2Fe-2S)-binding protein [Phycisphaerales bacterium]|nr:(2Fe-2S)-binding protein [Phycisphaerales bacterium]